MKAAKELKTEKKEKKAELANKKEAKAAIAAVAVPECAVKKPQTAFFIFMNEKRESITEKEK